MGRIPGPEEALECDELFGKLIAVVNSLPQDDAILFLEVCLCGYSLGNSASRLGLMERAASAKLYTAKKQLREQVLRHLPRGN